MSIRRRRFAWVVAFLGVAAGVAAAVPGCSSKSSGVGLASGCALNSDCDQPLVCIFSLCHQECENSRDCPNSEACVKVMGSGVCQLPAEAPCSSTQPCNGGLVCGQDDKCRAPCTSVSDCLSGQLCTEMVCYDPGELDGGSSSSGGGSGSSSGGGSGSSSGGSSSGGDAGDGGGGNSCPSAQTQFGSVVQGDSNPSFNSGIGIRTATQLLVFDGYYGPDPTGDGGGPSVGYVYAQAFDAATGTSQGPAASLLAGPTGSNGFSIEAAAVAPTGEIILLYTGGSVSGLWASFLTEAPDAGAGTSGLQVQKSFQISTTDDSQPQVFWSPASKAFVVSTVYSGPFMKVQKYLPNGNSAGASTDPVPTDTANASASGYYNEGVAAESNGVLGVAYITSGSNAAAMTALDSLGNQIGSSFHLVAPGTTSTWVTLGGTSAGLVSFFQVYQTGAVQEVFVPVASDGGIPAALAGDAGDAGAFPGFTFPGTKQTIYARALSDDVGGVGGVGVAILYADSVGFAYVNADGITHVAPSSLISHTYAQQDYIHVNNFDGSFGVSLFSVTAHSTQVMASGCTP